MSSVSSRQPRGSLVADPVQVLGAEPDERRAAAEATHQDADALTAGTTQEGMSSLTDGLAANSAPVTAFNAR